MACCYTNLFCESLLCIQRTCLLQDVVFHVNNNLTAFIDAITNRYLLFGTVLQTSQRTS